VVSPQLLESQELSAYLKKLMEPEIHLMGLISNEAFFS